MIKNYPVYLTEFILWNLASKASVQITLHIFLSSELNVLSEHSPNPLLSETLKFKILPPLKFLNEHYLHSFVLSIQDPPTTRIKIINATSSRPSRLHEHKFRHTFKDTIDPFCLCGTKDLETSEYFFLRGPIYTYFRHSFTIFVVTTYNVSKLFNCTDSSIRFR